MDKNQVWEAVLARLSEKISRMEFGTWFKKIQIKEISGDSILLACPTEMNKSWVESKYFNIVLVNIQKVLPEINKLFFEVDLKLSDQPTTSPKIFDAKNISRKLPRKPEKKFKNDLHTRIINPKFSLENFIVGEENRMAHAACCAITEEKAQNKRKYNPLFIYGGVGLGKTHLLQGTANKILQKNPETLIVYSTAERVLNELVKHIRDRKMEKFRKKYRQVDVFILDDVQIFEGKEQLQEELFNTFNDLYEMQKQIIFSADRPPSELVGISDRLRSRMGWGLSADVQMPNYETRLAIIQEKSKEQGLILPPDIQEFIAVNIRKNLRELENILTQIEAEIDLNNISPTIQSVRKIFLKVNPMAELGTLESARKGFAKSPDEIITAVSEHFQVPATELLNHSRKQEYVYPRQIAWVLCKDILKMGFDGIGKDFGGRNHTTIMHGIKKMRSLIRKDSATARHFHALKKDLGIR